MDFSVLKRLAIKLSRFFIFFFLVSFAGFVFSPTFSIDLFNYYLNSDFNLRYNSFIDEKNTNDKISNSDYDNESIKIQAQLSLDCEKKKFNVILASNRFGNYPQRDSFRIRFAKNAKIIKLHGLEIDQKNSNSLIAIKKADSVYCEYFISFNELLFEEKTKTLLYLFAKNTLPELFYNNKKISAEIECVIELSENFAVFTNSDSTRFIVENRDKRTANIIYIFYFNREVGNKWFLFYDKLKISKLESEKGNLLFLAYDDDNSLIQRIENYDKIASTKLSYYFSIESTKKIIVLKTRKYNEIEFDDGITLCPDPMFEPDDNFEFSYQITRALIWNYLNDITKKNQSLSITAEKALKGVASYLAIDFLKETYDEKRLYFKIKGFYIPGIKFISYQNIPMVYSIDFYSINPEDLAYKKYIEDPIARSINERVEDYDSEISQEISNYRKPEIIFRIAEKIRSKKEVYEYIKKRIEDNYLEGIFSYDNLLAFLGMKYDNYLKDVLFDSQKFDYLISDVAKKNDTVYVVIVKKNEIGRFPYDLYFITEKDTLIQTSDGLRIYEKFEFKVFNKPIRIEIDPFRKNVLDLNYSNNSYEFEKQYLSIYALSTIWFFWMQNLFMILGSSA